MEQKFLGDYQLIKPIGQGPLGCVYLAEHRFMKKQYAIKVLPEELSSDRAFIQRFEETVNTLTELSHPHIVKVYNISYADGKYFLIMDCIVDEIGETSNLAKHIIQKGHRLKEQEILLFLSQIADALDYAHERIGKDGHVVHGNIKLNNILLSKENGNIHLYLTDFSLMKIIGAGTVILRTFKQVAEALSFGGIFETGKTGKEKYGEVNLDEERISSLKQSFIQNFSFLSPEQKNIGKKWTPKTDIYSFGILAYYLLMQKFPEGFFPMPSELHPQFQWNWDFLIRSCLQIDPDKRPPSLKSLMQKIQTPIKEKEIKATSPIKEAEAFFVTYPHVEKSEDVNVKAVILKETVQSSLNTLKPIFHTPKLERPETDLDPAASLQVDPAVKKYQFERKEIKHLEPIPIEMMIVEGGTFSRGSTDGNRDEMPFHKVILNNFAIDIHPVTNEQFVRFLEVMGGEKDRNHQDIIRLRDSRIKRSRGKLLIESGYSKHPVVGVTWYGSLAYAEWVGKRLPTEAEWEVAASGGADHFLYPTGETIEKSQANFFSSDTTAVMSYPPNIFGLYDMAGNVYEWCQDWYGYNYYEVSSQEPENPKGPLQGVYRVLRGGCWKSLKEDLRCSRRHRNNPGTVNSTYGFRCVADVQQG